MTAYSTDPEIVLKIQQLRNYAILFFQPGRIGQGIKKEAPSRRMLDVGL